MDRNLDDDWLRRLNQLQYLNLRSICEGHPGVAPGWSQKPYAAIKLSLKDGISLLEHSLALLQDKGPLFFAANDTKVELHEDTVQGITLSAWIDHACPRTAAKMDDTTRSWFIRIVAAAERFDGFIEQVLHEAQA